MDFAKTLGDLTRLQNNLETKEEGLERAQKALKATTATLVEACKPSCLKAVEAYNATASYKIVPHSLDFSFNTDRSTLSLHVRMGYMNRDEPDEEFTIEDVEKIGSVLGAIVDKELKSAAIPLSFEKLWVPTEYYMK